MMVASGLNKSMVLLVTNGWVNYFDPDRSINSVEEEHDDASDDDGLGWL
jgi:hypothetical protein